MPTSPQADTPDSERLAHLVEASPAVIYSAWASGDFGATYISPNVTRQMGYAPEKFTEDSGFWVNAIHPDDRERVLSGLSALSETDIYSHEYRFLHADGTYRWMHDECQLARDAASDSLEVVGSWINITERKRVEKEFAWELGWRTEALRDAFVGIAMTRLSDGAMVYSNPRFERMFGYQPGELLGKSVSLLNGGSEEEAAEKARQIITELEKEGGWSGEVLNVRKDGSEFWSQLAISCFYHPEHGRVGMGVHEEISERKRATEALRSSESDLRALMEGNADGIVVVVKGRVVHANAAMTKISGYTPEEIEGKSPLDFVHPEDRDHVAERIAGVLDGTTTGSAENRALHCDGGSYPVEVSSAVITFRGKRAVVSTIRDITERKRSEEALRTSLHEKEILLKEVHHRVKNNLQLVASLLSLQSRHLADDTVRDAFSHTQQRVKTMALVHEQLLQSVDVTSVDYETYLEELVDRLVSQARDLGGPIEAAVQCEVAAMDIDLAYTLGLIVNELVSNAIEHAFPSGDPGRIRIEFRSGADAETYRLVVADDGIGIPMGVDPLAADTLGLRLVRLLASQIHGTLAIDIDGGTEWIITIPMDG